jgi:hypothetical protein
MGHGPTWYTAQFFHRKRGKRARSKKNREVIHDLENIPVNP